MGKWDKWVVGVEMWGYGFWKVVVGERLIVLATEIRCQEKTKGGVCYEVILAQPEVTATPPKRPSSPPSKDKLSVQDIEDKLKAAEERRLVS